MNRAFLFHFLLFAIVLGSFEVQACFLYPKEISVPADQLIQRTNNIVLARAIAAEYSIPPEQIAYSEEVKKGLAPPGSIIDDKIIRYDFEVLETYKGKSEQKFSLRGHSLTSGDELNIFDNHKDPEFWEDDAGRLGRSNCKLKVSFSVGQTYLMFLDKPYHRKSFERIISIKNDSYMDEWLEYVIGELGPWDQ